MTSKENNAGEPKNVNDDEVVDLVKVCYPKVKIFQVLNVRVCLAKIHIVARGSHSR